MEQTAEALRDKGIQRAEDHANNEFSKWSDTAYRHLVLFLHNCHGREFLAEEVRFYARTWRVPEPPSKRAWGGIMLRAAREGLIEKVGYGTTSNPRAHKTPATLWRRR